MTALVIVLLLVIAGMGWALWAQRREIERLRDAIATSWEGEFVRAAGLWGALLKIERATRDGKSGTARKVHRMAKEALK